MCIICFTPAAPPTAQGYGRQQERPLLMLIRLVGGAGGGHAAPSPSDAPGMRPQEVIQYPSNFPLFVA